MKENFYKIAEKFLNEKYPSDLKENHGPMGGPGTSPKYKNKKTFDIKDISIGDYIEYKPNGVDYNMKGEVTKIKGNKILVKGEYITTDRIIEILNSAKDDLKESTSKFTNIKVTYNDGTFYTTQISSDLEGFKKYLQVGSVVVTHEDEEPGKETKKKIVKIEEIK